MLRKKIFIERWASHSKFFALQGIFNSYKRFRGKIIGCENKNIICFANQGDLRVFYDKDELDTSKVVGRDFLARMVNVVRYIHDSREAKKFFLRICRLIYCTDFGKVSFDKAAKILKNLFNSYSSLMAYYRMSAEEFYILSESDVKEELKRHVPEAAKAYQILTSCELNTKIDNFKEQIDWLLLLLKLGTADQETVLNSIRKHALKYGFLGAGGGNPFGWDYNFFIKKFRTESKKNNILSLERKLNELVSLDNEIIKEKKKLIKKYKLSQQVVNITKNMSLMSYHRMMIREAITAGAYLSRPIFSHIYSLVEKSANKKIKFDILRQLSYEEMYHFLVDGKDINYKKVLERYKFFIYILKGNKTNLYLGKEARALSKKLNIYYDNHVAYIKGNPTYHGGKVYGSAMVIDNAKHSLYQQKLVEVMKDGDILITGMTRPNIILACHKASAIVTDEGGVTSHAAIISRELKKPCVVGTGKATKLIKTGDYLEVDSEKGIIRIISKISN